MASGKPYGWTADFLVSCPILTLALTHFPVDGTMLHYYSLSSLYVMIVTVIFERMETG